MVYKLENLELPPSINYKTFSEEEAQIIIDNFINRLERIDVPLTYTLNDFFKLMHNAIESRQKVENVPDDKRLLFVEDDPQEPIDTEAITFELLKRTNGSFSRGAPGESGVKELRPHIRGEKEHPEHPGEKLITFGKFYDNWIQFNIYARSNKRARERLLWLEGLMLSYDWYFSLFGFRVIYDGTGPKKKVKIKDKDLFTYPTVYFVRTDDIYHVGCQELKEAVVAILSSAN